ncbi:predicted protein [Nematostella vectensis]|uniref:Germinal-centre associated nuclear protein MCM3AP domain-containing protein n=1 Tax=Nematostella vectensis TaxID=45351 RepID=A7SXM9_NEMVE|nr:predicted protein [Nematostella vectensis]|eukprot:XP_001623634.1 predicted protein [Nematostella vectensis]
MRKKAGLGEQCPEPVVSLYNATVNHLAAVVSSPGLGHVSWPAPEFTADHSADSPSLEWNSPSHLATLRDYVTDLMLPDPPPGADDGTWESECALCLEYVKTIPSCTCGLVMRIRNILNRKLRSMQAIDFLSSSRQLSASEVPWTQVIEACISTVVTLLHSNPVLSETSVFYLPTELALFEQPLDWRDCVGSSKQDRCKELYKSSLQTASPAKRESMLHQSVMSVDQEMHSICEKSLVSALSPVLTIPQEDHGSLHDLQQRLSAVLWHERQESNNFEHMLRCLVGEESVTDSVTQYLTQSKKRKAESLIEFQGTKSSRHRTDGLISGLPDRRHETIETRLSQLQESIRDEREFTRAMEERMASYLKS